MSSQENFDKEDFDMCCCPLRAKGKKGGCCCLTANNYHSSCWCIFGFCINSREDKEDNCNGDCCCCCYSKLKPSQGKLLCCPLADEGGDCCCILTNIEKRLICIYFDNCIIDCYTNYIIKCIRPDLYKTGGGGCCCITQRCCNFIIMDSNEWNQYSSKISPVNQEMN
jgi:hypothetical protein